MAIETHDRVIKKERLGEVAHDRVIKEEVAHDRVIKKERLGEVPIEVVSSWILSRLTMKEAARTRLVSPSFDLYWRHIYFLHFENPSIIKELWTKYSTCDQIVEKGRCEFVKWVNNVLDGHMGSVIQEFKLTFYLDNTNKDDIDKWVVWALSQHVQKLELDFSTIYGAYCYEDCQYALHKRLLDYTNAIFNVKPVLTSLCLKSVNVTDDFLNKLLHTCSSTLENLCIMTSYHLTSIQTTNACSALRYFKVYKCRHLETIDIQAPNLVSFIYDVNVGHGLELLRIANASSLSHVSIFYKMEDRFFHILRYISDYFHQLEYLKLVFYLNSTTNTDPIIDYFPVLARLKHLEMVVLGNGYRNIAGWIPFIEACPLLEKLSLELNNWIAPLPPKNVKRDKRSLLCLKTFEINVFNHHNVDIDVAKFVLENALNLQEVILRPSKSIARINMRAPFYRLNLKIPRGVKVRAVSRS